MSSSRLRRAIIIDISLISPDKVCASLHCRALENTILHLFYIGRDKYMFRFNLLAIIVGTKNRFGHIFGNFLLIIFYYIN